MTKETQKPDPNYWSGCLFWNLLYWLYRQFYNRPLRNGTKVSVIADGREWMYPGPLTVLNRDWIPSRYNLKPGYLYMLQDQTGKCVTFHETWTRRLTWKSI